MVSVILVVLAGAVLYFARSGLNRSLDALMPGAATTTQESGEVVEGAAIEEPEVMVEETTVDLNRECDPEGIESFVRPLIGETEQLISKGRDEIGRFRGMSRNDGAARALRNQWNSWGAIWLNRLSPIHSNLPPRANCAEIEGLASTCDAVDSAMYLLDRVPTARSVAEAREMFDQAQEVLDQFHRFQEEEAEFARLAAESEAEFAAVAEVFQAVGGELASEPP